MNEKDYFNEIDGLIKGLEIKKRVRVYKDNSETLLTYWTVGKLLIEAQGGKKRAKYGNELVKNWSIMLTKRYGNSYNYTNLTRFIKFYNQFPIVGPLGQQLSWSHIRCVLPMKDENERNYYINQVIKRNLSKNELIREIKYNSYVRLLYKPEQIDIIKEDNITLDDKIKNPIIIDLPKNKKIKSENELEALILSQFDYFLNQLGDDYLLKSHQYKVLIDGKHRWIDLLLFNLEMNCYVVIELKLRKINEKDLGQTKLYMDAIDRKLKKPNQTRTMGIIISKENNKLIANFIKSSDFNIIPLEYELRELLSSEKI